MTPQKSNIPEPDSTETTRAKSNGSQPGGTGSIESKGGIPATGDQAPKSAAVTDPKTDNAQTNHVLESAWQLHADYNLNAKLSQGLHRRLRASVIYLSVLATFLAILSDIYGQPGDPDWKFGPLLRTGLSFFLILVPITSSVVLALSNKFQEGERWLALKSGAENALRVIYLYRTVLSEDLNRDQWLHDRLVEIRREALQSVKGNLAITSYTRPLPALDGSSEKLTDEKLGVNEYIQRRLEYQIVEYKNKIKHVQSVRSWLLISIFALGGLGSLLAAMANKQGLTGISIWVALSTAFAAALSNLMELRESDWRVLRGMTAEERDKLYVLNTDKASYQNTMDDPLESTVAVYSHIINELTIARDHWYSLKDPNNTSEFYEMVLVVERVLWGKDFSVSPQIQTAPVEQASPALQERTTQAEAPAGQEMAAISSTAAAKIEFNLEKSGQALRAQPRVVVLIPYGRRLTMVGTRIDFDNIYNVLIEPALKNANFTVYRWTETTAFDSIQELLLADIVLADISYDDADVFYNMGLRHAFRRHGIIHIHEAQARSTYGTFKLRLVDYHCNKYGRIDSAMKEEDTKALVSAVMDVWISDVRTVQSPIYEGLNNLVEPSTNALRLPLAMGYWRELREWRDSIRKAQRNRRAGDLLLLTEELQNSLIREDAIGEIGQILRDMGRNDLALILYNKGLEVNPRNPMFRREEAFNLNRTGRGDEAIIRIESILRDTPSDSETTAYLGRVFKEMWYTSWKEKEIEHRVETAIESYHWLLKSFESYLDGYRLNLNDAYPGVNALTLGTVLVELADRYDKSKLIAPDVEEVRNTIQELQGTLAFTLEARARDDNADYWALISLAELRLMTSNDPQLINRAYHKALTASRRNPFFLHSSLQQLEMLGMLGIREPFVSDAIRILREELENDISKAQGIEEYSSSPGTQKRSVYLFTGYMFNHPNKQEIQLPPTKEEELKCEIDTKLTELKTKGSPLAITPGMNGGSEIVFVERCVEAGIPVQVYLPEPEAAYIEHFVRPAGEPLVKRFIQMRNHDCVEIFYQPDLVGPAKPGDNVYERNNRWAMYSALEHGINNVYLLVVWDGKNEAAKDLDTYLVQHMVKLMNDIGVSYWYDQIYPERLESDAEMGSKKDELSTALAEQPGQASSNSAQTAP